MCASTMTMEAVGGAISTNRITCVVLAGGRPHAHATSGRPRPVAGRTRWQLGPAQQYEQRGSRVPPAQVFASGEAHPNEVALGQQVEQRIEQRAVAERDDYHPAKRGEGHHARRDAGGLRAEQLAPRLECAHLVAEAEGEHQIDHRHGGLRHGDQRQPYDVQRRFVLEQCALHRLDQSNHHTHNDCGHGRLAQHRRQLPADTVEKPAPPPRWCPRDERHGRSLRNGRAHGGE
mmetsp:Transcript_36509/g.100747  ORF Transcript_36509/g.100747 Transcript_36509/m.100747 type:complete len:232 (-) Transcript_36509:182-877(-)